MDDFIHVVQRVSTVVLTCIEEGIALNGQLDSEPDAIYIKSVEGTILHNNKAYHNLFAGEQIALGRHASSFLCKSIAKISALSDDMLMAGSLTVQFDHLGHDAAGRDVRLRTFKRTLLGTGHPTMAILGMTRLIEVVSNTEIRRLQTLKEQWRMFSQLDDFDRSIATSIGKGMMVGDISIQHSVTKKTIENHRNSILRILDLDAPIDLVKLMVRFQDNGFGDFGV